MESNASYSLTELCELAEVTPRTVRYYIQQGLLPSPGTTGPGARYSEGHLDRLRLTRRLQRVHLPLSEIRSRLAALADEEVRAVLAQEPEAPSDSTIDYVRTVLGSKGAAAPPSPAVPPRSTTRSGMRSSPLASGLRGGLLRASEPPAGPSSSDLADAGLVSDREATLWYAAPVAPDRSSWERIALSPDLELHVRRPLSRPQNRLLTRILDFARKLIQEDQP